MKRGGEFFGLIAAVLPVAMLSAACTDSDPADTGNLQRSAANTVSTEITVRTRPTMPQNHSQRATVTTSGQAIVVAIYSYDVLGPGGDMALLKGVLGVEGECIVVTDSLSHQTYVPIFPAGAAALESDATGLRLTYANHHYRINDEIELAGGAGTLALDSNCSLPGWTVSSQ